MSEGYQCNRCKKFTESKMTGIKIFNLKYKESGALHHLCNTCYKELTDFLTERIK